MLISIPFLIITFLVYALIPELRNLHGKCLMCYTVSLTILYAVLSLIQMDKEHLILQTFPCIASGYLLYFSVLLTFFWMNAMCYDIWKISRWVNLNLLLKIIKTFERNFMIIAFYCCTFELKMNHDCESITGNFSS
jgi:hypothetical protein